jgi:hypothetical protein
MTDPNRQRFMAALAKLVQPDNAEEAGRALLAMIPMLADMPERAFASRTCLNAVATAKRRTIVPSYADIRNAIGAWEREQPRAPAIGEAAGLDENARMWLAYFRRREDEYFHTQNGRPSSREHCLSLVKAQSLAAWERITGNTSQTGRERTDEEKRAVREIVAAYDREVAANRDVLKVEVPRSHSLTAQIAAARAAIAPVIEHEPLAEAEEIPEPKPIPEMGDEFDDPFPDEFDMPVPDEDEDEFASQEPEHA